MKRIKLYLHAKNCRHFWDTWQHKGDWEQLLEVKYFDVPDGFEVSKNNSGDIGIYHIGNDYNDRYALDIVNSADDTPAIVMWWDDSRIRLKESENQND